jgi:hypothetical protein
MSRRLSIAFLSTIFVYGLSVVFAPPALAVNCDVNACINFCKKQNPGYGSGNGCTTTCLQMIQERKSKGQCK